ncbi:uncharacterized protein PHACADRAFT_264508 [Phanerochaete carnosa HHB-10118-sp]|uniref:Uncharacterized protein n=1 Tax=Phanerochaete carnosa (strain HHB-10118-sp) TaxID=650164 RepID=K5VTX9_PHACS|nr:uncharacterized protein PHACADRAFT_264508 [Phanerochaete carnosa HHB-10118-sp]EKM50024.1 hypothetical protein PHACADRAFT_264508 [Phanerochaete carnosa HHB-10118-sp]
MRSPPNATGMPNEDALLLGLDTLKRILSMFAANSPLFGASATTCIARVELTIHAF